MSAADLSVGVAAPVAAPRRSRRFSWPKLLLWLAFGLLVFSLVRVITGANDITSSGTVNAAIGLAVPIGMAGLGGLWSERAGVVNIGLEGMLILGTFGAGYAGYHWGPWAGLLAAMLFGAFGGLLHAIATVTFGVDHIISGTAINILGLGVTKYLAAEAFVNLPGGGTTQSPHIRSIGEISAGWIGKPLGALEDTHWFFVSDLAGVLRGALTHVSWITVVAILLLVFTYWVLWRTAFGLRLRSCGEAPHAAESLGVNVIKMKYYAVVTSGALAGVGGAFLVIVAAGVYREGQTGGRGFIGLAAMIFGNWRPLGLAAGSTLFGYADGLQLRGVAAVHALLLVVAVILALLAAWQTTRHRYLQAVVSAIAAVVMFVWFVTTKDVPAQLTGALPYVTTLLVLSLASQRLRMPTADGQVYRRGEE